MIKSDRPQKNYKTKRIFILRSYDYLKKQIREEYYTLCEGIRAYNNLKRYGLECDLIIVADGVEYCLM